MSKVMEHRKKKYFSDTEKRTMVDKFLSSGLAKSKFCSQANISESALYRWQRELGYIPSKKDVSPSFIPIQPDVSHKSENKFIILKICNKLELLIPVGIDSVYLSKVIKGLMHNAND